MDIAALLAILLDESSRDEQLAALDDAALAALEAQIADAITAAKEAHDAGGDTAEYVKALQEFKDAKAVLSGETERRATVAAEALAAEEAARAEAAALEAELMAGPEDEEEDEPETPVAPVVAAPVETVKAARRPSLSEFASVVPIPEPRKPAVTTPRWQALDGGVVGNDLDDVAARIIAAQNDIRGMANPPGFTQKIPVVRMHAQRPQEMILQSTDLESNMAKIQSVTAAARQPWTQEQKAIVASGGWCAPGEPRYDIPSIASAARPVRDGLPRMGATRGTINFVRAARLSTILANQSGAAVTTWENTTDEVPGESTKTRQTHACRTIREEELGAIVARMRFGNFQQRAFPEDVAHDLELLAARHARVAEVRLMDALIGDVNIDVAQTGFFGTVRDVKHHFAQAAAEMRFTERTAAGAPIRAIVPDLLLDMIPSDVAFQTASGELDALLANEGTSRAILNSVRGLNYIFTLDTPTGADAFVTNSDGENLADWPDNFEIPFFYEGTVVFADGGTLDLGIIRDSTLNNTNDYEVFMETFEGLLWLGPYAKTLTLTTCPNGYSQLPQSVTTICSGS
jgi:hypothetical protein